MASRLNAGNAAHGAMAAIRSFEASPTRQLLLLLDGFKVIDDRAHVLRCKDEFRHVRMAG